LASGAGGGNLQAHRRAFNAWLCGG